MAKNHYLDAGQLDQLSAFRATLSENVTSYLDPTNNKHREIIQLALKSANRNKADFPNLFKAHENGRFYGGDRSMDTVKIVDAGKTKSGKATATIWSANKDKSLIKGGSTFVFDHDSKQLLAFGANITVQRGFLSCSTQAEHAADAGEKIDVLHLGHVTNKNGDTRFYAHSIKGISTEHAHAKAIDIQTVGADTTAIHATIYDPQTSHGNTDIQIALGRMASVNYPSTTDYIYCESTNMSTNPYLIVPFVGNAPLSGTIDFTKLTISNFETEIYLNKDDSTQYVSRETTYTTDADVLAAMSPGAYPNILEWNFPFDGKGSGDKGYQNTASIVYYPSSLVEEKDSYFFFAFKNIPYTDGTTAPPFYVCSTNTPDEGSVNCTKVLNLYFWWHCLLEGTKVLLEDGREIPIEEVNETHRIVSSNGKSYAVSATVRGYHSSKEESIHELTTENGAKIVSSNGHIVFLDEKTSVKVGHVQPGDIILTASGPSKVVSNNQIDCEGMFVGLMIGSPEEQMESDFPKNFAGYMAGGILNGDQNAYLHHANQHRLDLNMALKHVHPDFHADYTSAVNQIRY